MGFIGGGFFGSGGSESTTTNQTVNQTNETGFSEVSGTAQNNSIQGNNNAIYTSDFGALSTAKDIALGSLNQVELANNNAASLVSGINANAQDTISQAVQAVSASARSETENIVINIAKWAGIAAIAYALMKAFRG